MREHVELVSVHGGHSGEFSNHASNTLEEIIQAYCTRGFSWVGIAEHMPPVSDDYVFPEDSAVGFDAATVYERFSRYIASCRQLQEQYASSLQIYVGFETEVYTGSEDFIRRLVREFRPDYIVGSVHHVNDIPIDMSPEMYAQAIEVAGGIEQLYCDYFDQQYDLIDGLRPAVVGHFDLVRIFDGDYRERIEESEIQRRIRRNLERIEELGAILDFNVRAWEKGADEPYVSRSILLQARELGIAAVPGDDSHGVEGVGLHIEEGIEILQDLGFDTNWRAPVG